MIVDADHDRSPLGVLAAHHSIVEPGLRAAVDRLPATLCRIAGYHFGWWDRDGQPVTANPGKAIRPTLALLVAEAVGGSSGSALPAAVAVELVHNFSLLHDDVMDTDRTRRHRPAAWTVFGAAQAILAGDAMLALAGNVLADAPHPWRATAVCWLNESVVELCDGQSMDLALESLLRVDLASSVQMVQRKTASLLGVSCALGALAGGAAKSDQITLMRRFGEHLGLAFQLVDDLLGIWGNPAATGKPVGRDLARRKKSLPVVAALASGTSAGAELLSLYSSAAPVDVARAGLLIERSGGRDWAQRRADDELARAMACLDETDCPPHVRRDLVSLAQLVVRRDH